MGGEDAAVLMTGRGKRGKKTLMAMLALCAVILGGCGGEEAGDGQKGLYFVVDEQERQYPEPGEGEKKQNLLGVQFHGDEVLQIRYQTGEALGSYDLYLCHEDGSSELIFGDVPRDYLKKRWFMDQEGAFYLPSLSGMIKLDRTGGKVYEQTGNGITDICQLQDGRILLMVQLEEGVRLAELEKDTGAVRMYDMELPKRTMRIGTMGDRLILLDSDGFWEVDAEEGTKVCVMEFLKASYELEPYSVAGFRLLEDGRAEILADEGIKSLELVDVGASREIVRVRDWTIDSSVKNCAFQFNRENDKYYVVLEEHQEGIDMADFRERTGIEAVAGKGADIICSNAMDNVLSYIEKGLLEDLTPYLEKSGLKEEDYFPAVFGHWRYDGKIYGVELVLNPTAVWIDEEILGGREMPGIETLVGNMLAYEGKKKWFWDSGELLGYLLRGSEDLWGMVDWEKGNRDFTGVLFLSILEVSRRQGGDFSREKGLLSDWAETGFTFLEDPEVMESEGRVFTGFLFNDGGHVLANEYGTLGINSGSQNKEGAWEFLCYALSQEVQEKTADSRSLGRGDAFPVNRAAMDVLTRQLMEDYGNGLYRLSRNGSKPPTLEDAQRNQAEIYRILEDARFMPVGTEEILNIILEEAGPYFDGAKSAQDVAEIIQNRVALYLGERYKAS